jgi:nucleoside-diphosphate kinase
VAAATILAAVINLYLEVIRWLELKRNHMRTFLVFLLFLFPLAAEVEKTLSIIKPDAVKAHHIGDILSIYEKNGLEIVHLRMVHLSPKESAAFYEVHKDKGFYQELVDFMASGPSVAVVLKGENAIAKTRELMGAKDKPGSIRALYGTSVGENAVHGSDSKENAVNEILFFFPAT